MDRASSSSTFSSLRRRQPSPRRTKGIICHTVRAIFRGVGRKRALAALTSTLPTSFSSKSRFSARLLWAGRVTVCSASRQENWRRSASISERGPE